MSTIVAPVHGLELPGLTGWLTTTDHKRIGILYITAAFAFFLVGGVLAEGMRAELAVPGIQLVGEQGYDQLFTMHGTIMLLLFGTPMAIGLANYVVPLQIGTDEMSFPRVNALSFWMFLTGSLIVLSSFLVQGGPAAIGWTGYVPLSDATYEPGVGVDLWIVGLILTGLSAVIGAVNFIATIYGRRTPGMTMFRMPIFTWNILVTALLIAFQANQVVVIRLGLASWILTGLGVAAFGGSIPAIAPRPRIVTQLIGATGILLGGILGLGLSGQMSHRRQVAIKGLLGVFTVYVGLKMSWTSLGGGLGSVARELTKVFEEVWRGKLADATRHMERTEPRGEHVVVVGPAPERAPPGDAEIDAAVRAALADGRSARDAASNVADALGVARRRAYEAATRLKPVRR